MVDDNGLAGVKGQGTSVDVEFRGAWSLIWGCNTSEVGDDAGAGLGIESLNVTALTDLERGADVALVELEAGSLVDGLGEVSIGGVGADEGDENDLTSEAEELRDFSDTADVFGTVLLGETEILVETSPDDISVEEEDLLVVADEAVDLFLEGFREGGLASS